MDRDWLNWQVDNGELSDGEGMILAELLGLYDPVECDFCDGNVTGGHDRDCVWMRD